MCNLSLQHTRKPEAPSVVPCSCSTVALSHLSPSVTADPERRRRRRWTTGELTEILDALAMLRTNDLARIIGVNPKALRSVLRRNGISLRAIREHAKRKEPSEGGLVVRRSTIGPSATYGAAALENLPDHACRWSLGDPADPSFAFCGAPVAGRAPYCTKACPRLIAPPASNWPCCSIPITAAPTNLLMTFSLRFGWRRQKWSGSITSGTGAKGRPAFNSNGKRASISMHARHRVIAAPPDGRERWVQRNCSVGAYRKRLRWVRPAKLVLPVFLRVRAE